MEYVRLFGSEIERDREIMRDRTCRILYLPTSVYRSCIDWLMAALLSGRCSHGRMAREVETGPGPATAVVLWGRHARRRPTPKRADDPDRSNLTVSIMVSDLLA
jgi:hypothetical protein